MRARVRILVLSNLLAVAGTLVLHGVASAAPAPAPTASSQTVGEIRRFSPESTETSDGVLPADDPVAAPAPAPAAPAAPPAPPTRVPGQEATVTIASAGITLPVVLGGQDVIDRGVAAHYAGPGWRPPVGPGQAGTYWLAAHHETHGSPFANLPNVHHGDRVVITTNNGRTVTYVVTSTELVGTSATMTTVYGPDRTTPRILLQTCIGASHRLLVHGVLAS